MESMKFKVIQSICDKCWESGEHKDPIECSVMEASEGNAVAWYCCGHVYIIQDNTVEQIYDYNKKRQ